jgi:hypothetical protein
MQIKIQGLPRNSHEKKRKIGQQKEKNRITQKRQIKKRMNQK